MVKLPKTIRIGLYDYTVKVLPLKESFAIYGDMNGVNKVIRVTQSYDNKETVATFLHELWHAIFHEFGIDEKDDEERIVHMHSLGFCTVLRDNPGLLRFIKSVDLEG